MSKLFTNIVPFLTMISPDFSEGVVPVGTTFKLIGVDGMNVILKRAKSDDKFNGGYDMVSPEIIGIAFKEVDPLE